MTNVAKITALVLALGLHCAQAAEPTVITLACDGKATTGDKSEPIDKMGLVVNFTERTVSGFGGIVAPIGMVDAAQISFGGTGDLTLPGDGGGKGGISVIGDIDRVTGAVVATTMTTALTTSYELLCKVTKRLF
jgi:hypothetical protein